MPVSRIALLQGKPPAWLRAISDSLHLALVDAFDVPPDDRFQIIQQLAPHEFNFDRHYLGGPRSDDFILVSVTAGRPRSDAVKQAFYRRLVELLEQSPGIAPQDVMVTIQTTAPQDWSFSAGRPYAHAQEVQP